MTGSELFSFAPFLEHLSFPRDGKKQQSTRTQDVTVVIFCMLKLAVDTPATSHRFLHEVFPPRRPLRVFWVP